MAQLKFSCYGNRVAKSINLLTGLQREELASVFIFFLRFELAPKLPEENYSQ
jgi:hypothetical protein